MSGVYLITLVELFYEI